MRSAEALTFVAISSRASRVSGSAMPRIVARRGPRPRGEAGASGLAGAYAVRTPDSLARPRRKRAFTVLTDVFVRRATSAHGRSLR